MIEILPDTEQLFHIFSQATAPAFFLGATAGLISIFMTRLTDVMGRLRTAEWAGIGNDPVYLLKRARLLLSAIKLALAGGICTTVLLAFSFISPFVRLQHVYGAALLFLTSTALIGGALFRFFQEVRVSLDELNLFYRATFEKDGRASKERDARGSESLRG
jgi:hypothetical protein